MSNTKDNKTLTPYPIINYRPTTSSYIPNHIRRSRIDLALEYLKIGKMPGDNLLLLINDDEDKKNLLLNAKVSYKHLAHLADKLGCQHLLLDIKGTEMAAHLVAQINNISGAEDGIHIDFNNRWILNLIPYIEDEEILTIIAHLITGDKDLLSALTVGDVKNLITCGLINTIAGSRVGRHYSLTEKNVPSFLNSVFENGTEEEIYELIFVVKGYL